MTAQRALCGGFRTTDQHATTRASCALCSPASAMQCAGRCGLSGLARHSCFCSLPLQQETLYSLTLQVHAPGGFRAFFANKQCGSMHRLSQLDHATRVPRYGACLLSPGFSNAACGMKQRGGMARAAPGGRHPGSATAPAHAPHAHTAAHPCSSSSRRLNSSVSGASYPNSRRALCSAGVSSFSLGRR